MKKLICAALAAAVAILPVSAMADTDELVWGDTLPKGLDPHVVYDVPMQFYMLNTYDTLYRYVGNPPELAPWLVEGHSVSGDGLEWTFTLREGITFQDGSALTADDVVYSFQRLLTLGKGPSGAFRPVMDAESVTKVDDRTVKFTLKKAYAPFLAAVPLVAIVNEDAVKAHEQDGDWGTAWLSSNGAGSGAYIPNPHTYVPQEKLDLAINENHFYGWGDNPDPIEIVRAYPVKETATRVLALMKGDVHATDSYLPTDQVEKIQAADGVQVAKDESMRIMIIRMNNKRAPFDNKNFRKCVNYAFDFDGFISVVLGGYPVRNPGPIPKNLWGAPADLQGYTYDLGKATEYCNKARAEGVNLERPLEIHIQTALEQTTQAAEILQAGMASVGVQVELIASTWPTLTSSASSVETTPDMWVHWVSTYFVDPENWIGQMYDSDYHGTWKASAWYQNNQVDQLLRQARAETDQAKRAAAYEEASRIIVDDAADIWIYNTVQLRGLSDKVEGYKFSPVGSGGEIRWMSLAD